MDRILDFLITRTWWTYDPSADWYASLYHWINLVEGGAWVVFAVLVLRRYLRHRKSPIELVYALAFATFGLSDFREAYIVESWLILFKAVNLAALLVLRSIVIKRHYPGSRTF